MGKNIPKERAEVFSSKRLWVADYRKVENPLLPDLWDDWVIWQYTDKGRWPNVESYVDFNRIKKSFLMEDIG